MEDASNVEKLIVAIIVQAAADFTDAYRVGLINPEDHSADIDAIKRRVEARRKEKCRHLFPRWMSTNDIVTSVYFIFEPGILEGIIPHNWFMSADQIRDGIIRAAKRGTTISNHFCYAG
jgi:hypothetical protein